MAVGLSDPENLTAIPGVRLATVNANIKRNKNDDRADLLLLEICQGATVAATFTQNAFCAAPVLLAKKHIAESQPRYLLINSGNANAGTGEQGVEDAVACCKVVAEVAQSPISSVLPFSTGVIGEYLPVENITSAIPGLFSTLNQDNWLQAARAIMTTDTVAKAASAREVFDNTAVTITGIAKGSGMIHPNMATMLAYIATDAKIEQSLLNAIHQRAVSASFNRITVDGDTSTNDACVLIATGKSEVELKADSQELAEFEFALQALCLELAQAIVRDGEGATKFVEVSVSGGESKDESLKVAQTVALSPLVKTALFASDANWGRIIAAVGRAGIESLDINKVSLTINQLEIMKQGLIVEGYRDEAGNAAMQSDEIVIEISLGRGDAIESVWTCDLSHGYVDINSGYRS